MHKDFHLFGTYLVAYNAGFDSDKAALIACAAQAVDDFTEELHPRHFSCQTNSKVAASFSNPDRNIMVDTWVPFHFLPCHIDEPSSFKKNYKTGRKEPYSANVKNFGTLYNSVAQNLVNNYKEEPSYLAKIGVVMHVLADTFAHQSFSGKLENSNIVKNAYIIVSSGKKVYLELTGPMEHIPALLAKGSDQFKLGHGSIGHLPDISWAYYKFTSTETNTEYTHDNKLIFSDAFCELSSLLHQITQSEGFADKHDLLTVILNNVYMTISEIYNDKNKIALETDLDQTFAVILNDKKENLLQFTVPPDKTAQELENLYTLYLNDLKGRKGHYQEFLDAVIWHRNFVESQILEYDSDYPLVYF